jgi:pilus assembly protein CpaC
VNSLAGGESGRNQLVMDIANREIGMFVHYTTASGHPERVGWLMRVLICSGIALWMLAVSGAVATSSATIIDPNKGPVRLSVPLSEQGRLHDLEIESGKSVGITTDYSVKRISVGDPEILDVVALGSKEFQLAAKAVGVTNVLFWDTKGRPQAVIEVHVGTPYTHIERALRRSLQNDSILVEGAGNALILRGSVSSDIALDQALKLAEGMISGNEKAPQIVNLIEVGGNHQVMLKVVIAEMSRTLKREFGTNFAALISTGEGSSVLIGNFKGLAEAASGVGRLFGRFSSFGALEVLEFAMDILEEEGLSKVLAEPTLVARSGESASFLVGGEVPIPVLQGGNSDGITIEYHKFGVGLLFTPTVLGPDRIHIAVNPEVSRPDFTFGTSINDTIVPAFETRRASTSVELADGQSFMIAGLLNDEVRELAGKYPLLGSVPILGSLFRSTQFIKEESELVIIVTPTLVKPLGLGPHPLPTDHFVEPSAAEFYLWGALEGMPPAGRGATDQFEAEGMIGDTGNRITTSFEGGAK